MSSIKIEGLTKSFGDLLVLDNLSLDVKDGEILCIVGPSGCGKSTILRAIVGLDNDYKGAIHVDGELVDGHNPKIGFVFQEHALFLWRTIIENIKFPLEVKGVDKKMMNGMCEEVIRMVGLEGFENCYPYELSGGMKQRAALARVIVNEPDVLLMDEPFAAVDAQTRNTLQEELINLWQHTKKTIIFVTHSIDEATYLGDRIAVLDGRPSKVRRIFTNEIPRPRDRTSVACVNLRRDVLEVLTVARSEV